MPTLNLVTSSVNTKRSHVGGVVKFQSIAREEWKKNLDDTGPRQVRADRCWVTDLISPGKTT